jgi:FKBP-type peptidyl-prolyl cis-trans isomerase FkpA
VSGGHDGLIIAARSFLQDRSMSEVTAVPIRPLQRGTLIKLWLAIILLCLAGAALAWVGTRSQQEIILPSGAHYRVLAEGHGAAMTSADVAALRYKLHVDRLDAPVIQDSDESGQPFVTSVQEVFPGFADALVHMKAGGRYLLWLPPGTHVAGNAPPGAPFTPQSTLVFEINMLQIAAGMASQRQMQMMQQMMQQQQQGAGGAGAPPGAPPAGAGSEGGAAAPPAGNSSAGSSGRR